MTATLSQVDAILGKSAIKEHFWVKEGENLNAANFELVIKEGRLIHDYTLRIDPTTLIYLLYK